MEQLGQLRRAGLFRVRVPRYTSYPPASRFAPAEGTLHQKAWLNAVPRGAELSLYIHVPYCKRVCWFCACRTQPAEDLAAVDAYLDVLRAEIALLRKELPPEVTVSRLYLGGGTPTMVAPSGMERLIEAVRTAFPQAGALDFSVEIDTTSMSKGLAERLIGLGMTRAVVGVQDFDPTVQAAIGRPQDFSGTLEVVRELRDAGLRRLDMELLYGLPAQTARSIAETTQQVLALDPDRLAVCEYAHIPSIAKRQVMVDARRLPEAEDAFCLSEVARQTLLTDGYEPVGVDHFVRPGDGLIRARSEGRLRRDFQGYSDNATYALIGLGASAISHFPQGYTQNVAATSSYVEAVKRGHLPGDQGYALAGDDFAVSWMIEGLMCHFRIDLAEVSRRFPASQDMVDRAVAAIRRIFASHVSVTAEALVLHATAHPLARLVAHVIDIVATSGERDLSGFEPS